MNQLNSFPGGSKSRINKAGDAVRNGNATIHDYSAIEEWRAAHRAVLNTFQAILRNRTRGTDITVAQRHKRKFTIFDKLQRLPGMRLSRMDDVAGCRLIFESIKDLKSFRHDFHNARFRHKKKNAFDKYNYIKTPKSSGYRGIHDVYIYDVNSVAGKHLKGLMVEIQYRTKVQHAWATAVEVIGFISESHPKFGKGDYRYGRAMALASEILARSYESSYGPFPEIADNDLVKEFLVLDYELRLLNTLRRLNIAGTTATINKNSILIFHKSGVLEVKDFKSSTEALSVLFVLEKEMPGLDIVLVKADSADDVRFAFKNYFSDARDFINLVECGCDHISRANRIKLKNSDRLYL